MVSTPSDPLDATLGVFRRADAPTTPRTATEIADELDCTRRTAYNRLERLAERGDLETKKVGARGRVWWRPLDAIRRDGLDAVSDDAASDDAVSDDAATGLDETDLRHSRLVANVPGVVYRCRNEPGWPMTFVSEGCADLTGYDPDEVESGAVGWGEDLVHPDDRDHVWDAIQQGVEDGQFTVQYRILTAEGETRWVWERGLPVADESTANSGEDSTAEATADDSTAGATAEDSTAEATADAPVVEGVVTDITEQKRTERALRESERRFRSLVKAVEEYAIFRLDTDGRVVSWNEGAERIKGYDADEIVGEHVSTFYTEADRAAGVPERDLAEAEREGSVEDEGWRLRADGTEFWANVTVTAIRDDDGELAGYAKVTRDMTDDRHAEAERTLLYSTTRSIAAAESFEAGLCDALREVCEATDWEFGEAWMPTGDGRLERASADYAGCDPLDSFAAASEEFTFERGEGLPGRVWESGDPEWVRDATGGFEGTFARNGEADDHGLGSALGVPITSGGEVVAVLVLAATDARPADDRMIELLSSVGTELGELVERQRAEDALARETELTERVIETAPVLIGVFDADSFELLRANAYAAEFLGASDGDGDGGGRDAPDALDYTAGDVAIYDEEGDPVPRDERPYAWTAESGDPVTDWICQMEGADGERRWFSIDAAPIADEGAVEQVVVVGEDVTRLKEQTRRLERQREELRRELDEVFERIDDAFYALDADWRYVYLNERAEELFETLEEVRIGRRIWDVIPESVEPVVREHYERAMATQTKIDFELLSEPLDAWLEFHLYPSESGLSVYFHDVTERKARERRLEEYERIVETVEDGVYVVDEDGEFVLVNDAYAEMTGYDRDDLLGSHVSLVVAESVADEARTIERELRAGETDSATAEAELRTAEDERVPAEATFALLPSDGETHRVGVVRDVSERKQFEETLRALHDSARGLLRAETRTEVSEVVAETASDVLDLPGVVVYHHDAEAGTLAPVAKSVEAEFMRRAFPDVPVGEGSITGRAFAGGEVRHYDDVLDDPNLHVDPADTEMRAGSFAPMGDHAVLVAGSREVGAFDHRTRQLFELLAANAEAAYDRVSREERIDRQRERLAALDELNGVVRDINEALVRQSTREEVESVVCERLAASESYEFAWFGEVDSRSQTVELRTEAGVEGYLDGATISVAPDDDRSKGPTGRAVITEEMQLSQDIAEDPDYAEWRDHARDHGFRSSAAIPVVHEGTLYGVLNVYASRADAFTGEEREVVGQLGEVVGHAIASIDRKRALLSDELVELEFQVRDVFGAVGVSETEGTISLDRTVPVGDDHFVAYGTTSDDAFETVETLVERLAYWESVTRIREEFGTVRFELHLSEPPALSVVASHGGSVEEAVIEDGDYRMTLDFPTTVDVRNVVERVREAYPTIEVLTRQQVSRSSESLRGLHEVLADDLTDRQRTALEAAYSAGFFEWPRDRSATEVADTLGVTDTTFHQHLRLAENKLLTAVFEELPAGVR